MWHANLKTSWAQPNPNLTAHNHYNKVNTYINAWNIVMIHMWCNAWCFKIKYTKPIPKFCKNLFNFEKPPNFQQIPKVRSQKMKCIKTWMRKSLTKEKKWSWDRRTLYQNKLSLWRDHRGVPQKIIDREEELVKQAKNKIRQFGDPFHQRYVFVWLIVFFFQHWYESRFMLVIFHS